MARPGKWERRYKRLQKAVIALYSQAMWTPDRYVENENELWKKLRDAAGIEPGTKTDFVMGSLGQQQQEEDK